MTHVGITALGVRFPSLALPLGELANLRGIDPDKFRLGLGCHEMALCAADEDAVTLAVGAARRALEMWGGDPAQIGLLAVGTETAKDMSRPLSAFVAEELGLSGNIRSYEVKHACYGGTLALRQAAEWRASGAARGKVALVIAADVALYAQKDPGEATQGAGAVAFIVGEPEVAEIELASYAYSRPAFDFWRPVGQAYPSVEGQLSLDCYKEATQACFEQLLSAADADGATETSAEGKGELATLRDYSRVCFHVPFPKMVKKAVGQLQSRFEWSDEETASFYAERVAPTMAWNQRVGNCYTASLWASVASALAGAAEGERFLAFSYGSGFGAELLTLVAGPRAKGGEWAQQVEADLDARRVLSAAEYESLRAAGGAGKRGERAA